MHDNTAVHAVRRPLTLILRRATPADLPGVLEVLAEAAGWLNGRGVRQWPAGGFPATRIDPLIAAGTFYVLDAEDGTAPAATIALDRTADPEFWTAADQPESASYVHKLCTSRAFSGLGLGPMLLDWAGLRTLASGLRWLRLDCAKTNGRLQDYYRGLAFRHVRTVDLPHRSSGALFQRVAGLRSGVPSVASPDREVLIRDLTTRAIPRRDLVSVH